MKQIQTIVLLIAVVVLATMPVKGTLAQNGDVVGLEEIVVTAERREASLQSVPIPVSALSRQAIDNRQVGFASDLERYVPSLKMRNNITSPTNLSPSLRGSVQQDASLVVAESPFGIYVDGVYIARMNGNNVQLNDLERVEVLRGPQGTLYGRNTLAGAINFITRTPSEDNTWLDAEVGYGRYDAYRASVSAGGALSSDVAGSISLHTSERQGFYNNAATGEKIGDEKHFAGRAKLHFTGSDVFSATASLSYTDSDNDALQLIPGTTPNVPTNQQYRSSDVVLTFGDYTINRGNAFYGPRGPAPIENETRGETKQLIASLHMSYDFGNATLKSVTAYVDTEDYFNTDFGGVGRILAATVVKAKQFTQELQIQGSAMDDRLNYIAGVSYFDETADQDFGWQFVTPTSTTINENETDSIGIFGQADLSLTDDLKVTAGIRYVKDDKDMTMTMDIKPTVIFPVPPQAPVALENSYTAWTPKFGIDYTVPTTGDTIDSMLLYASMARGFKSGGYNTIAIFNLTNARIPYGAEKNWTYELGIKTDLAGNRLRINANYFVNRISELGLLANVVDPATGAIAFTVQNAGAATIRGLEGEITAVPSDGLNLFANFALMSGKFRSLDPTSGPALAPQNFGVTAVPPQVPDYSFTVGFDYGTDFSLGNRDARFKLGADWYRTDDFLTAANNDFVLEGYDRVNGFVALELDTAWELRLAVKNLTDEVTISTGSRNLGGYHMLPRREYFLSAKYSM